MSFTREQLVEYQQLTKLLRFVKVCSLETRCFDLNKNLEWRSMYNDFIISIVT
jgi:hypothetical protein